MNPEPETQNPRPETRSSDPATVGPGNAYTDAPKQHPNLILGALQLLFWLFFHPSAWRSHVTRIDPDLRPDFCLVELSREQWRSPVLRRLLVQGYVLWPLLSSALVGLVLWGLGASGVDLATGVAAGLAGSLAGVAVSVAGSVASGVAAGVVFGVVLGIGSGVAGFVTSGLAHGAAFGVAGGVVLGMAHPRSRYSFARQAGGVVAGVLIGIVTVGAAAATGLGAARDPAYGIASGVAFGAAYGVALGGAIWLRTGRWRRGVVFGLVFGIVFGVVDGLVFGIVFGVVDGLASAVTDTAIGDAVKFSASLVVGAGALFLTFYCVAFALPFSIAERVAGPWAGAVAGAAGGGGAGAVMFFIIGRLAPPVWLNLLLGVWGGVLGLMFGWWRPIVLYPFQLAWNAALLYGEERRGGAPPRLLRLNAAFWDEGQRLRLAGLDDHLVLAMERDPVEGRAALAYVANSRQRWAAQSAQIELDARGLERCTSVEAIGGAHGGLSAGELAGPASSLLRSFSRISQDVDAALSQEGAYNQRLALSAVEDRLDGLNRELTRSDEPYALRFRPITDRWRQVVADRVQALAQAVEVRQEIDSPYVIGIPLTERQEIFVGRGDVSARIEQLLLDRRRPPLLLYGQRRTGKTSLLNNLGRLLPSTIVPLLVDLQGPASLASDHAGLLYNVARAMIDSASRQREMALPPLTRETLADDPFTRFDEWLDAVEASLGGNTALLLLDEFEALDGAIARDRFEEEAVLGTLRHWIQHRPRFKVLISGSHTLDEVQRWASYLINVQVVRISYLKRDEARQLVESPVEGFALRYEPEASQRVLELTHCHPFLVQLLCAEIVALKNEQPVAIRRLARLHDVEAAVPEALEHGSFFFADIERNQVDAAGLALLRFLAAQGERAVIRPQALAHELPDAKELDHVLRLLTHRELIEPDDEGYRFQVEMIRRWFAQ